MGSVTGLFYVRTEVCPVCGRSGLVRLAEDWQAQVDAGAAIMVIDCGNPWHYVNLDSPAYEMDDEPEVPSGGPD